MQRYFAIFSILVLMFMQCSTSIVLATESTKQKQNGFEIHVKDDSTQDKATVELKSLISEYERVNIKLPEDAVYDDSMSRNLNQPGVEFSYKKNEHVLEFVWDEGVTQNVHFVLTNLSNTDNDLLLRGIVSDEIVVEETHSFTVATVQAETDEEKQEQVRDADEVEAKELKPTITPFAGNLNVDIDISAQNTHVNSGNDAAFKLVFKTTGSMKMYTNAKIVVDLPESEYAVFNQDTTSLIIAGVEPKLTENNQLIYEFDTLKTGQTYESMIKLKTINGVTLDGTTLDMKVSFEAEEQEKIEDEASVIVNASSPVNISKQFTTIHGEDSKIPLPNSNTVWKIKVDIPKSSTGQLYLEEDSQIRIVDELPDGLTYHSVLQGPVPVQENNKLIWVFDAPSIEDQEAADKSLFDTEIEVVLRTGSNTADMEITNKAEVELTFIENKEQKSNASHSIKVFESDPSSGEIEGTLFVPVHIGPLDGKGNRGNDPNKNPDPIVYDDAILSFDHGIAPLPLSKEGDFIEYITTYNIDEHLIFKELISPGGFVYRPGGGFPAGVPLKKDPVFNIEANIDGENIVLIENAEVGTVYTRADLGIASDARVNSISLNFTYAPSGMLNVGKPQYYFEVEPGYVGEVKNTWDVHGIDGSGKPFANQYNQDPLAGPRTAQIAEKPTDQPPIATVGVELTDHIGSYVESGKNRMRVILNTENSSTLAMTELLNTVVLLPPGVKIDETPDVSFTDADGKSTTDTDTAIGGDYEILSDNHNNSGRQLVKFNWNDRLLRPGNNVQAYINVVIDDIASNTLTFDVYGFSGDEQLSVPDVDNPGLTNTVLQIDDDDLNRDGNTNQPRLKSGNEYYMSGQYNIKTEKLVKGELDDEFSRFGKTIPGGLIEYKLMLTNTTGQDISSMTLMDVLPSENDLGITDNMERGSLFTPSLKEPIKMPDSWKDKVDVYYSTALTPERDDLTKHTKYPDTTEPLSNPDGAEAPNWKLAADVDDWSHIRSFKIELKDGVAWIAGQDITIDFSMVAPNDVNAELLDKTVNPAERAAWNSFAIATDQGQPVEPLRVGIYMELDNSVQLVKQGEDGEILQGAEFTLFDASGNIIEEKLTTDENGQITVEGLFPGKYKFVETKAPDGYQLDSTPLEFEITSPQEQIELTFENPLSTGAVELTKVSENGEKLEGAAFRLEDEEGNVLQEDLTTDEEGKLVVEDLKPGKYQFIETEAPFGYELDDTPRPFEIVFNQQETVQIEVENLYTPGTFELTKTGEDGELLAGVTFELQDAEGVTLEEDLVTNEDGILTIDNLDPGKYQLVETATIDGYDLIDEPIPFEIGLGQDRKTELTFENPLSTGAVELIKVNENGEKLEGAAFRLEDEEGNVLQEDLTTDEEGKLLVEDLKPGKYQFIETEAPFGYELDDTPRPFEIAFNQQETIQIEVENLYTPATFELTKTGEDGKLLAGVTFELQDADGETIEEGLVTNADGILTIDNLDPGKYQLVETATIDGYDLIDEPIPFEIGLGQDKKTEITFENPLSTGAVELIKVNENGEKLEGAVFRLEDEEGNVLQENLTTDEDGKLLVENLKPGKYQFIETEAPASYRLDTTPFEFTIEFGQKDIFTIEVENEKHLTTISGVKKWKDNNNAMGDRPESITVQVMNGDDVVQEQNVTAEDEWIYTFTGLIKYDAEGEEIAYTINELPVPGYATEIDEFNITNIKADQIDVAGTKIWKDGDSADRPDSITIQLFANGREVDSVEVTAESNWEYAFTELPKYDEQGVEITYTVDEEEVEGYEKSIEGNDITNLRVGTTEISGEKTWVEVDEHYRPDSITVNILANGEELLSIEVSAETDWKFAFTDLAKYDTGGKEIEYTIEEVEVPGYLSEVDGFDITNTQETTEITGTKTWKDDSAEDRPESITVQVMNADVVVQEQEVTADNDWNFTFTNLAKYDSEGNEVEYTINELPVPGYATEIDGFDITNTKSSIIDISGTKTWKGDNAEERPASITVQLLANGEVVDLIEVTAETDWTYIYENVEAYDSEGRAIVFTVAEVEVGGYETSINGFDITNTLIPAEEPELDENAGKGETVPKTATNIYNLTIIGFGLMLLGLIIFLARRKRIE